MSDQQPDQRRYEQVKEILQRVLEMTPGARSAYLQVACGDDAALRADVEAMLAAHDAVNESFLDSPLTVSTDDVEPSPADIDLTGKRVGAYRLERLLGRGGMGAVYLGSRVDGEFSKHVAVKFIRTSRVSPGALKRFKAERQILADIDHPNIARLIDGGTAEGMPFFIMEYVPGDTLAQAIERGPLPIDRATRLAVGVAEVLEAIHAKGMVFRDLKPSNIIVNADTGVKVLDFGIAKLINADNAEDTTRSTLTSPGFVVGSPRYMSPEQAAGEVVDARSDVFSFGLVMFEVLTGHLPFHGATRKEYFKNLIADEPEALPASVPARFRAIVEQCLRKSPDARFRSGRELADAVREMSASSGRFFGSRASWVALLILTVLIGGYGIWTSTRPPVVTSSLLKGPARPVVTWSSSETNPRFSPDMKWLSFLSDRDGQTKIWLRDRQSGGERAITAGVLDLSSHEWSPKSDRIAYATPKGIAIVTLLDGKTVLREVTNRPTSLVRWIGDRVYFLSARSLWRYDLSDDQVTQVTTAPNMPNLRSVDVSADERNIVYTALKDTIATVFYAAVDGSKPVQLTTDRMEPRFVRWKGVRAQQVVYVSAEGEMIDLWELDVTTHKRDRLTLTDTREGRFDVSSDGKSIAYEQITEDAHLASLDPSEAKPQPKLLTTDSLADVLPHASDSGAVVVFQRAQSMDMALGHSNATIRVSRDNFQSESEKIGDGHGPEISPDGLWASYLVYKPGSVNDLWVTNLTDRRTIRVSERHFAYSRDQYPHSRTIGTLAWSPVGPTLYFLVRTESGGAELWSATPPASGLDAQPRRVLDLQEPTADGTGVGVRDLHVSGDGTRLSYLVRSATRGLNELHEVDLARIEDRIVLSQPEGLAVLLVGWNPRDNAMVVLRGDAAMKTSDVLLVTAAGQRRVGQVTGARRGGIALDAAQRTLYFTQPKGQSDTLQALLLDTGLERQVYSSEPTGNVIAGLRVLRDGRLIFSLQSQNNDIISNEFAR